MELYIRVFTMNGEVIGSDRYSWNRTLEDLVVRARRSVREYCEGGNRLFIGSICVYADLGPMSDRLLGRRSYCATIWEARPIDDQNPGLGYKERFPNGTFNLVMPDGERPIPEDGQEWHEVILNLATA